MHCRGSTQGAYLAMLGRVSEQGARRIDIAPAAIFKIIAAVALVWLWVRLWPLLMLVLIAVVIAIGLEPVVAWLQRKGVARALAATSVVVLLAALVLGFFW